MNFAPKDSKEGEDEEILIGNDMGSEEELIPDGDNVPMGDLFFVSPESMDEERDIQMEKEAPDPEAMIVDQIIEESLRSFYSGPDVRAISCEVWDSFILEFCGAKIRYVVPLHVVSETSGEKLEPGLLRKAMPFAKSARRSSAALDSS